MALPIVIRETSDRGARGQRGVSHPLCRKIQGRAIIDRRTPLGFMTLDAVFAKNIGVKG